MRIHLTVVLLSAALATTAAAQTSGARPDNYYGAANRVDITSPMPADVIVAGRDVTIRQPVAGDIVAAGWRVTLTAQADDDVRLAASDVLVDAPVAGDVTIAGGTVTLGHDATVGGRSWMTGRTVRIDGVLDREVNIAAADVVVSGEIRGPARIVAERFEVASTARLLGPVSYRGPKEAVIADGATVSGPLTYTAIERRDAERARQFPGVSTFLFSVHLFLAGLLAITFLPRVKTSVVDTLRRHPGRSLVAGFTSMVTVPAASLVLIASVLGLPFGLMLAAAFGLLLFAGAVTTALFIGEWEGRWFTGPAAVTRGRQVLWLLAGVLTLALLRSLVGGLVVFIGVLFGFGALTVWLYKEMVNAPPPPAAA